MDTDLHEHNSDNGELARLRAEADDLIRLTKGLSGPPSADPAAETSDVDKPEKLRDRVEAPDGDGWDGETEREILVKALEEAELEYEQQKTESTPPPLAVGMADQPLPMPHAGVSSVAAKATARPDQEDRLSALSFPSIPTAAPIPKADDGDEDELEARMRLLTGLSGPSAAPFGAIKGNGGGSGLPSVPSARPGQAKAPDDARQVGQGWNLPGWADGRDDDLDSWCCE